MFIMSVDLESWVHRPIFGVPIEKQTRAMDNGFIPRSVDVLLGSLARFEAKATFFCLGSVAEWYPEAIRAIANEGHELAVHGYTHKRLSEHTRQSFEREIERTQDLLGAFGDRPIGFRATTFSYAPFMYEVLEEHGFQYDSSVLPIRTPLYDWSRHKSSAPFWGTSRVLEIPISVYYKFAGIRIPVGGFYFRLLGGRVDIRLVTSIEREVGIAVFYVHPWELVNAPPVPVALPKRVFAYYRIPALQSFEKVLGSFPWTDFRDSLGALTELLGETGNHTE
jgi:polysaccharide deacetylase family protein (PEP-CTERM system associated)